MTFVLAVVFVVVVVVAYAALRNAQDFSDANEVVPGVATGAPKSWAGAHSPEARLHRRLRDAIVALQANTALDDPSMISVRAAIEEQALAVDERLIAVAALPKSHRSERLVPVDQAVQAIEGVVARVVDLRGPSLGSVEQGLRDVEERMRLVEAARAELEAFAPGSGELDELRRRLAEQGDDPEAPGEPGDGPDRAGDPPDGEAGPAPA